MNWSAVCAIEDAMAVAQNQPQDVTDGNGIIAVLVRDDRGFLEYAAHAQDGTGGPPFPVSFQIFETRGALPFAQQRVGLMVSRS
jgi:hypothetical protein